MIDSISHWGLSEALLHGAALPEITAEQKIQLASFGDIGGEFKELLATLPQGRAVALANTKIDEALHWVLTAVVG